MAEARAGWNDEKGRAADTIPGLGLAEVVGARETDVQTAEKGKAALRAEDGLPGLKAGEVLPGRWYEESPEPAPGARVVAEFASGAPAAVASTFGKGKALMLGSYVSAGYVSQPEEAGRRFFEGLVDRAGVRRPVAVSGDALEVRPLESGREHVAFVFNHASPPATATLTVRIPLAGRTVVDIASGQAVAVTPTSDGFGWRATVSPLDVRVLRVR